MGEARRALTLLLTKAEPWPVVVVDRLWNVVAANDAARRLYGLMLGEARLAQPLNHMKMYLAPNELKRFVVNWPAVARGLLEQVRAAALAAPGDEALQALAVELLAYPDIAELAVDDRVPPGPLCEIRFASQSREIGLIGTSAAFTAPLEETIRELRIETFLPSDDDSDQILRAMAGWAG